MLEYDDVAQLAGVSAPTLLLWGSEGALFSREDQHRLLATLPSAQLKIYEDTGHCRNWERRKALRIVGFRLESRRYHP